MIQAGKRVNADVAKTKKSTGMLKGRKNVCDYRYRGAVLMWFAMMSL